MTTLSIVPGEAAWRARAVRYYAGDWAGILTVLPEFSLVPFNAGEDEPANPFLQTVMRKPLSAAERPIPYGLDRDDLLFLLNPDTILGRDCGVETFKALRNRETRTYGEYRTPILVLEAWDRLAPVGTPADTAS